MAPQCPFCRIVAAGDEPPVVWRGDEGVIITPLDPVTPGHLLAIPREHAEDFTVDRYVAARAMWLASAYCAGAGGQWNLITSAGRDATQTVMHLHLHLLPRRRGDGVRLPWTAA